jgi:AcrR family transcriptional regulator
MPRIASKRLPKSAPEKAAPEKAAPQAVAADRSLAASAAAAASGHRGQAGQAGQAGHRGQAGARAKRSAARRDAILAAALEEFSGRGFAATRLEDVARRADVAKGTIYLHFADKETLFEELISSQLSPVVGALEHVAHADVPIRVIADQFIEVFIREIYGTRRKDVIRLIVSEGPRFPQIAEFYYREVLSRVIEAIRGVLRRAVDRGEIRHASIVRFPQLLAAPAIVAILWNGLFDRFEPLDVRAFMRAHFDILFDDGRTA